MIAELKELKRLTEVLIKKDSDLNEKIKGWTQALDAVPDLIFITDLGGDITFINQPLKKLLGVDNISSIQSLPCFNRLKQELKNNNLDSVLQNNYSLGEIYVSALDGWFSHTMSGIKDEFGEYIGFICVLRDINIKKDIEFNLKRSEDLFKNVTKMAADAIIITNIAGKISSWNSGAEKMFGYAEYEILGENITKLMPERYIKLHSESFEKRKKDLNSESSYLGKVIRAHGLRKSGEEFPIELVVSYWVSDDGVYFSGILRDISKIKDITID